MKTGLERIEELQEINKAVRLLYKYVSLTPGAPKIQSILEGLSLDLLEEAQQIAYGDESDTQPSEISEVW